MGNIELDKEFEEVKYSSVCTFCKHLQLNKQRACDAFPGGIPSVIWNGQNNHKKPYPGDHGIRFERISQKK